MILVVEDNEDRLNWFRATLGKDEMMSTRYVSGAIAILNSIYKIDRLFLDRDLGQAVNGADMTVEPFIDYIVQYRPAFKGGVVVHSTNFPAASGIVRVLRSNGYTVHYVPFTKLRTMDIEQINSL